MREILFRGKGLKSGEWHFGELINTTKKIPPYMPMIAKISDTSKIDVFDVAPETIGQYTGLTDKNGKKIFEGDIVAQNWYDHNEPSDDSFGEVVFCEYDCSFSVMDVEKDGIVPLGRCHAYHWEAEVIGNIHDNPELMKAVTI